MLVHWRNLDNEYDGFLCYINTSCFLNFHLPFQFRVLNVFSLQFGSGLDSWFTELTQQPNFTIVHTYVYMEHFI